MQSSVPRSGHDESSDNVYESPAQLAGDLNASLLGALQDVCQPYQLPVTVDALIDEETPYDGVVDRIDLLSGRVPLRLMGCFGLRDDPMRYRLVTNLALRLARRGRSVTLVDANMHQPVLAAVGDSTFFHAVLPALINAVHHQSDITLVILDNSGTAMTGFQPHPGLPVDVKGDQAPEIDIVSVCEAIGARVEVCDPFDLQHTQQTLFELLEDKRGVKVLVLKQICALSPEKKAKKMYEVEIDETICLGENCGCNRLCTRVFKCPGLIWDHQKAVSIIDEVICAGCGVCATICPAGAISKKEVA